MTPAATARPPAAANGGEIDILRSFARRIDPSDAGAYNNLGVLYFRKGLTDEAIVAFSRALALDERMGVARRNLEIAYGESGILERRLHDLEERLRANPEDLEALVQSGIAEKTAGRLEKAHTLFQRAIELDTDSSVLHFLLAETLYNRGLHEDAMRSVRRSIELNPENPDALYLIGFILGDLGRSDEAAEANRRAVMLNPTLVRAQANLSLQTYRHEVTPSHQQRTPAGAHITLGRALRQKGYFQEALREYEKAIEGGEANAEVLQAMLELYLLQRDTGAAIATADRFAREFSPTAKTWNGRGVALQLEGRHSEAEESYNRALEIDSSYPFAHNNIGVLIWHKSDTKNAINAFRRALQAPSPPVEARLNLALGLFRRKHIDLSLEAYRQVLSTAPEHPVAWNGIGLILVELEKYSDARNAFARAIQANPDFAEAHYNLSFTLSNLGDFSSALRET
jgi:tetratricopeptide (TPR) repeat protein